MFVFAGSTPVKVNTAIMFAPNPADLAKDVTKAEELVEQLGTITLEELNKYHCNNQERRLLSLFGIIFDVTSSEKGYGKDGACKFINYGGIQLDLLQFLTFTCPQTKNMPGMISLWRSA